MKTTTTSRMGTLIELMYLGAFLLAGAAVICG